MPRLVIVGAGLTGLSAAQHARMRGWTPLLIDKGRGPGGRLATRWLHHAEHRFDTGAQFFSVRHPDFAAVVASWASLGLAEPWSQGFPVLTADGLHDGGDGHVRWRIAGGMNRLAKHLAQGCDVRDQKTVIGLRVDAGRWRVTIDGDVPQHEMADAVMLTQPVPQMLTLLESAHLALPDGVDARLRAVRYDPCICLLLDAPHAEALLPEPGGVRIDDPSSPISWIASQRRKHLRHSGDGLVVHFRGSWSAAHYAVEDQALLTRALNAAAVVLQRLGISMPDGQAQLKKWRYSLATASMTERCVYAHPDAPLLLAGDAFGETPRVEGAWLSGQAAAEALAQV